MAMLDDPDYLSDTTNDVESIPEETVRLNMASSPNRAGTGRKNTRSSVADAQGALMRSREDTEELIRGFILEKDILKEEHKKEKEEIVESLINDRNELIEKFRERVSDLEKKIGNEQGESSRPKDSGIYLTEKGMPIYIRMDKNNVVSAEDFLSRLRLEDKYETEKDTLERSFRDERRLLKDKMEFDYNTRLQQETSRFRSAIDELKRTIANLKHENRRLEGETKSMEQDCEVMELETKSKLQQLKTDLEASFSAKKIAIREELEAKYAKEMDLQRAQYENVFADLKGELRSAGKSMANKEKEVSMALNSVKDYEERVRRELSGNMSKEYELQLYKLRRDNERLSEQVDKLERHRDELAGRVKELDEHNSNKMSILSEFSSRLNSEYEERLKRTVLENENLRIKLEELQADNQSKEGVLWNYEKSIKRLEEELSSKHVLINGSEETKGYLRNEIKEFSHEIDVLRKEKSELQKEIEEHKNSEKTMKNRVTAREKDADKALDQCKILEREKLNLERRMSLLGEELKQGLEERETLKKELEKFNDESCFFKEMLDKERKERTLLSERFRRDAEEIRKKESECCLLREELRLRETKGEMKLHNDAKEVDKIMELEAKNSELEKQLDHFEERQQTILQKEREDIQKQFAKEFARRIQTLKRNYEEAAEGLKNEIKLLRSKISELEPGFVARNRDGRIEFDMERKEAGLEKSGSGTRGKCGNVSEYVGKQDFDLKSRDTSELSPGVRIFDYAMNRDATSSKNNPRAPANAPSQPSSAVCRETRESSSPVYQGAFSRQRSRSLEAANGKRFEEPCGRNIGCNSERTRLDSGEYANAQDIWLRRSNEKLSAPREDRAFERDNDAGLKFRRENAFAAPESEHWCHDRKERGSGTEAGWTSDLPPKYMGASKQSPSSNLRNNRGSSRFTGNKKETIENAKESLSERYGSRQESLLQTYDHGQWPKNHSFGEKEWQNSSAQWQLTNSIHEQSLIERIRKLEDDVQKTKWYACGLEDKLKEKTLEADDAAKALILIYSAQAQNESQCDRTDVFNKFDNNHGRCKRNDFYLKNDDDNDSCKRPKSVKEENGFVHLKSPSNEDGPERERFSDEMSV